MLSVKLFCEGIRFFEIGPIFQSTLHVKSKGIEKAQKIIK
jgi:hypothetical protein